jgi:hypothetical protein
MNDINFSCGRGFTAFPGRSRNLVRRKTPPGTVAGATPLAIVLWLRDVTGALEHVPKKLLDFFDIWTSDISDVS